MKVVILCGGLGTRLREETEFRPKPLVEIGGRPILWHIIKSYAHYGHRDFVLCLGYRGSMIKEYFLNYQAMNTDFTICLGSGLRIEYREPHEEQDFHVTLAGTGQDTLTGGRVKRALKYIDDSDFMVTYGDGVGDVDLDALVDFHRAHGRIATVTAVRPVSRFGVLTIGNGGVVSSFIEKPQADGWVSAGFFVFRRNFEDYLTGDDCLLEQDALARLAHDGELRAYCHEGFWHPLDTYRDFLTLNELWRQGAPWMPWRQRDK